jgi:TRAP-type mannitol/chloroaromatic compound transport system permease large subunit
MSETSAFGPFETCRRNHFSILSPPVAMSAFYLKGVSPPHVSLNQIFVGMMPYMLIVIVCMVIMIMYVWPAMTLWLPNYFYGN